MKTKYPNMFGLLAVFMLVASLVVPANMVNPAPVEAGSDSTLRWAMVDTPNAMPNVTKEVWNAACNLGSEINKFVVASNGATMYAITNGPAGFVGLPVLYKTTNFGINWSAAISKNLFSFEIGAAAAFFLPVWDVAVAPDDPNVIAVVLDDSSDIGPTPNIDGPGNVFVSTDGGVKWDDAAVQVLGITGLISSIDISMDYGGRRDILIGTRDGNGAGQLWVRSVPGMGSWVDQTNPATGDPNTTWPVADVLDAKFSPTYVGDSTIVAVVSDADATYVVLGNHDLDDNTTTWGDPVEVKDPMSADDASPDCATITEADLELPSDFSGQAASLRRAYVSLNAYSTKAAETIETGIYRIDDTTVYELMDTTTTQYKDIHTIAYYGTYASGKLLAGGMFGDPCTATVPTWFTDSPTTCPVPCWYDAKKPTTGAAGCYDYAPLAGHGWGNAVVNWSPDGTIAWAGTGSATLGVYDAVVVTEDFLTGGACAYVTAIDENWPEGYLNRVLKDESGFALSRNNGETWNQLSLIDTHIIKLTDKAISADCTTLYLASTNNNTCEEVSQYNGFDSVWRTSTNSAVMSPLPAMPIGTIWERVLCHLTALTCNVTQSEYAILRLAPDKEDGQIVFWAAGGTGDPTAPDLLPPTGQTCEGAEGFQTGPSTKAVLWSPDYGDYWATINSRLEVQDMVAESSTQLYILSYSGLVQRLPYTGTAWSSAISNGDTLLSAAHTIAAYPEGKVLVGAASDAEGAGFVASYSSDEGLTWGPSAGKLTSPNNGRRHVAFDTNFDDTGIFFLGDDTAVATVTPTGQTNGGTIWRNTIPFGTFEDMLNAIGTAYHRTGYYGLAVAYTGDALYGAHSCAAGQCVGGPCDGEEATGTWMPGIPCAVERTIYRYWPIPKPNIPWDCLNVGTDDFAGIGPCFTLEPSSLNWCGCLTLDTDTVLYAIDNDLYGCPWFTGDAYDAANPTTTGKQFRTTGMLWRYTDCLAKVGPTLITEDGLLVGCDPVSGRNQEINFGWEQLCLAFGYDIEIAKDEAFTMKVVDYIGTFTEATWANTRVPNVPMAPAWIVPVAATLTSWVAPETPGMFTQLESGHKYYWKVKVRTDAWGGAVRSPWSEVRSFTIKAGLPVSTPYYGPQLLSPNNGCIGCPVSPASFSWSPFKGSTSYKFQLASDAAMTAIIAEDTAPTTAYEYTGTLDYSTNYFWRVMAVEPAPSDWSATFSFQTGAAPAAPAAPEEAPATPLWVWVVIALGAILVIVTLVLIFKTRRA